MYTNICEYVCALVCMKITYNKLFGSKSEIHFVFNIFTDRKTNNL